MAAVAVQHRKEQGHGEFRLDFGAELEADLVAEGEVQAALAQVVEQRYHRH